MITPVLRRAGRVLVPAATAAAVATLGMGAAAAASNLSVTRSDGSSATGSTTTSDTCFHVVGTVPASLSGSTTTLTIVDPSGGQHAAGSKRATTSQQTIPFQFSTSALSWDNSCSSGGSEAPNGTYTAKLSGGVSASASFDVEIPSATPQGFTGAPNGNVAVFTWQRNNEESDFIGYDIADSSGHSVTGVMHPGDVCNGSTCSVSVDFGSAAAGTSPSFTITSLRSNGAGGEVRSDPSSPATVNFPAPPSPTPSPTSSSSSSSGSSTSSSSNGGTTSGGGTGGTTGATTGGGKSSGRTTKHVLSGKHPAADLRSILPLTSAGNAPDLPSVVTEVAPLPEGTYKPTLAYPDQLQQEAVRKQVPATVTVAHDIVEVLDKKPLWRALAGAALLFLLAAHMRAWLARLDTD